MFIPPVVDFYYSLGSICSLDERAHFELQAFDLVHEIENNFDAGQIVAANVAQTFDPAQVADGAPIEIITAISGINRG
jgi:hypothetical protein